MLEIKDNYQLDVSFAPFDMQSQVKTITQLNLLSLI